MESHGQAHADDGQARLEHSEDCGRRGVPSRVQGGCTDVFGKEERDAGDTKDGRQEADQENAAYQCFASSRHLKLPEEWLWQDEDCDIQDSIKYTGGDGRRFQWLTSVGKAPIACDRVALQQHDKPQSDQPHCH